MDIHSTAQRAREEVALRLIDGTDSFEHRRGGTEYLRLSVSRSHPNLDVEIVGKDGSWRDRLDTRAQHRGRSLGPCLRFLASAACNSDALEGRPRGHGHAWQIIEDGTLDAEGPAASPRRETLSAGREAAPTERTPDDRGGRAAPTRRHGSSGRRLATCGMRRGRVSGSAHCSNGQESGKGRSSYIGIGTSTAATWEILPSRARCAALSDSRSPVPGTLSVASRSVGPRCEMARETRAAPGEARGLNCLGEVEYARGNRDEALAFHHRAESLWREVDDVSGIGSDRVLPGGRLLGAKRIPGGGGASASAHSFCGGRWATGGESWRV